MRLRNFSHSLVLSATICTTLLSTILLQESLGQELNLINGTFHRDDVSYFSDGNTMQTYPTNVARTTTVLSCSASDGKMIYEEGPLGEDISPWCSNSRGLYGINPWNPDGHKNLYLSEDGVTWGQIYTSLYRIMSVFSAANDTLIAWLDMGSSNYMPYYSLDNGVSWAPCINADGGNIIFPGGYPYSWNFNQRPPKEGESYGTIIASTYNNPNYPHQIWRSTDNGITWKKVCEIEPYYISHFHAIGYHPVLDKWVTDTGDGQNPAPPYNTRQHTYVSNDDGQSWSEYAYNGDGSGKRSNTGQVTRFRDYGHPTRLLIGSDQSDRIGWVDLITWEMGTFMTTPPKTKNDNSYFFEVFKHDNLWYGCLMSEGGTTGYHTSAIYVSPDLEHWAIYHRFSDSSIQGGTSFVGFVGGKLHIRTNSDYSSIYGHFSISPAKTAVVSNGLVLTPVKTNLMTKSQSLCETASGWSTNIGGGVVPTTVSDVNFAGSKSLYFQRTVSPGWAVYMYGPSVSVTSGQTYIPHFWVQGNVPEVGIGFTDSSKNLLSYSYWGTRDRMGWTELWGTAYTVSGGISTVRPLLIYNSNQIDGLVNEWIGAAEVTAAPYSPWYAGRTASPEEYIDHTVTLNNNFTHLFSAELMPSTNGMGSDSLYLCTYYISPTDYVELYYDALRESFALASTSDSNSSGVIFSNSRWLHRHSTAKIAVRYSNGSARLSVADGDGIEHVSDVLMRQGAGLQGASRIIRTGNHDGSAVIPHILYDSMLYNRALSNQEVNSVFNTARISYISDPFEPNAVIDSISPNPVTLGKTITFTGHGTDVNGTIVSYRWDSSLDGHLSDANSFSTTSLSLGHHIITFTVTDNNGFVSPGVTQEVVVNVPVAPEAFIDSISPNPAVLGETVVFTGHGTDVNGTIVAYRWDSSLNGHLSDANSFSTTLLSVGYHIITFTVTDNDEMVSQEVSQELVVNAPCSSIFNLDGDITGLVNFSDFAIFAGNWLAEGSNLAGDFNNNDEVDFFDFALFGNHWLTICNGPN